MNLEIAYLYRDASNYKKHGAVIVSNPESLSIKQVENFLLKTLEHLTYWPEILLFRPEWVGLKPVFLFADDFERSADDHDWHEINFVSETTKKINDPANRTIEKLLTDIRRTHKKQRQPNFSSQSQIK